MPFSVTSWRELAGHHFRTPSVAWRHKETLLGSVQTRAGLSWAVHASEPVAS